MRFEELELTPYAQPVVGTDLANGAVYFSIIYLDDAMTIPTVEPIIFLGMDIDATHPGAYFQDFRSYKDGVRFGSDKNASASFYVGSLTELQHIFDYDRVLDELIRCAGRRNANTNSRA